MARIVSFVVLVVILLAIFALFFMVMADFLLPLFLAVLLVVIFGPVHRWFLTRCKGHDRLAALLTTIAILVTFFAPASFILSQAAQEAANLYKTKIQEPIEKEKQKEERETAKEQAPKPPAADEQKSPVDMETGRQWAVKKVVEAGGKMGLELNAKSIEKALRENVEPFLAPLAVSTGQFLGGFLIGLIVMILALYYFLADGRSMVLAIMRLSPLDDRYEAQLIDQFTNVTRAVVLATLLSALAQGVLAGIGYYFAGVGSLFLLTVLTMLLAIIPFIGAAGIWVPVCLWLCFVDGRYWAGAILALYCAVVVSNIDNVIKPYILQGRSNIHPLLALLSVIGGVNALGPIGIVVGPMAVVFLQTLLEMTNKEMAAISKEKKLDVANAKTT